MYDDDLEVIQRIKNGDEGAYRIIVEKYQFHIQKHAFRILGDIDDAVDVAVETFSDVFFKIKDFKPYAKFRTYLYKTATNKALNLLRKKKLFERFKIGKKDYVVEEGNIDERKEIFLKALKMLDERERTALSLVYIENIPRVDAAKILKVTPGNLDVILHRAKEKLKKITGAT